ncbi:hypothetical protein K439DRAFT_1659221 [Ramaria rubella]|nr:hypothetical protein K439DRAFT_1665933 [Ramaria rubella]KAF8587230.1 hypothetical protein K439DRAFT_1659221 [Ramaria rubella]
MRFLLQGLFVLATTLAALAAPVFRRGDTLGALNGLYLHDRANNAIGRPLALFNRGNFLGKGHKQDTRPRPAIITNPSPADIFIGPQPPPPLPGPPLTPVPKDELTDKVVVPDTPKPKVTVSHVHDPAKPKR